MKRLLGLLLVMGMVGCGGGGGETVDIADIELRGLLYYESNSKTPFTGVAVSKHANGQKESEMTFKDGNPEGLSTQWHKNGQKESETTWKGGVIVSETKWDEEGNEIKE